LAHHAALPRPFAAQRQRSGPQTVARGRTVDGYFMRRTMTTAAITSTTASTIVSTAII
jgi:hypothetical protein